MLTFIFYIPKMISPVFKSFITFVAVACTGTALLAITGMLTGIQNLESIMAGLPTMKINTAVCFILSSVSLYLLLKKQVGDFKLQKISAAIVFIIALITFAQDVFLFNTGLDEWLIKDDATRATGNGYPGRMATSTALCFMLVGFALFALSAANQIIKLATQFALHCVTLISFIAAIGYLYNIPVFYKFSFISSMALNTTLLFLLLSTSATLFNSHLGLTGLFTSSSMGSVMAKRLFPLITVIIVLVLGVLRMEPQWQNKISEGFGITMLAAAFIIISFVTIAYTAKLLNKLDAKKSSAEESLKLMNVNLERLVHERTKDLQQTSETLSLATKGSKAGIWDWDIINNKLNWDDQMYSLYGIKPHSFSNAYKAWVKGLHPEDRVNGTASMHRALNGEKEFDIEFRVIWPDGSLHYIQAHSLIQRDADGKPVRMVGTNRDITDRYKSTKILKESEEQLKAIFTGAPDAVVVIDEDGNVRQWNQQAVNMFGWSTEEIIGKSLSSTIVPLQFREAHNTGLNRYLKTGVSTILGKNIEIKAIKKGNIEIDIALTISPISIRNKQMFLGFIRDITEQKKKDEIILNNERKYRQAMTVMGDNVWEHDFKNKKTIFAETIHEFTGYAHHEITDEEGLWWNMVHPDDRWMLEKSDKNYKEGKSNHHHLEYRIISKDASLKWVLDRGVIIEKDNEGMPLKIVGTHTDITSRKLLEEAMVENEKRFRDLTQNVPGVIYQWEERSDGSFGFTYMSPKLKEYFGLENTDLSNFAELIHPEDKERWRNSVEESNRTEKPWFFEGRIMHPDGSIKWWQGSSIMSKKTDKIKLYNGILLDLTPQKEIEQKLQLEQKRFESIFNSAFQFIGLLSPQGILLEVNETALRLANVKAEDVIGKHIWDSYWCLDNQEVFKNAVNKAIQGEFVRKNVEINGENGKKVWVDFSLKPIFNELNEISFIIPEGRDITDQLTLQAINKEQEEKIRMFVKHTPAAVAMFDRNMNYIIASDKWYSDYGLEHTNIIGKNHFDIFPEVKKNEKWMQVITRSLAGAIEISDDEPLTLDNGITGWMKWEIRPWEKTDGQPGGIIMFTEIITEKVVARENLKKLNQELITSNKELEQFAYVASHDLQEPLRMVSSFLQLLEKKYKPQLDDTAKQYIHFAVDGAERMKILILDLLSFSRIGTQVEFSDTVDVNKVFEEVQLNLLTGITENNAKIKVYPLPEIKANKVQITQLFQNLISNAIKYRSSSIPEIEVGCTADDEFYNFYVKDNGIGIENKYFEKIFVIFQRLHNKEAYSGTGVGLSICKKIVEKHGGKFTVTSALGKGSIFKFTIAKNNIK